MNIELRNLQIQDRQSEETTAFTASLYIDGRKVGYAKNSGKGGITDYGPDNYHDEQAKQIIKEAEAYCESLAPNSFEYEGQHFEHPSNLEVVIDRLLDEFWQEREKVRFNRRMAKDQTVALLIGNERGYKKISWPVKGQRKTLSIAELLSVEKGKSVLVKAIKEHKKVMSPSERILNTNIPKELL